MRRHLAGLPVWIWLLWAAGAVFLACSPMLLTDPAMWMYLLDPELLALLVIVGLQQSQYQILALWIRLRSLRRPRPAPAHWLPARGS